MAQTFICVLRGINVSGSNKLAMKQLAAIAEDLGLTHCKTYIQSGNLVFEADSSKTEGLDKELSDAIEKCCGFRVPVMLYQASEWDAIIAASPFKAAALAQPKTVHVLLINERPSDAAIESLKARDFGSESWSIGERAIYLHLPDGMGRSKLGTRIERILKVAMTGRNWNTMLALQTLMCSAIN
jgi:uncharacterized protein (DUF1697 family)